MATFSDVQRRREQIRLAPCLFQALIEKRSELRVTIVGERVFAVAIDSPNDLTPRSTGATDQNRAMYSDSEAPVTAYQRLS